MAILLLTRPKEAAARFAEAAASLNLTLVFSPILKIEPLTNSRPAGEVDGVIFSSVHGVTNYTGSTDVPCHVVGARTREAAVAKGFIVEICAATGTALVDALRTKKPRVLLHVRGVHTAVPLASLLRESGFEISEWIVYDQVAQPLNDVAKQALAGSAPVILPMFSPRSASLLSDALAQTDFVAPLIPVALSDAIAAAFSCEAAQPCLIAARPEAAAMLDAVNHAVENARLLEAGGAKT